MSHMGELLLPEMFVLGELLVVSISNVPPPTRILRSLLVHFRFTLSLSIEVVRLLHSTYAELSSPPFYWRGGPLFFILILGCLVIVLLFGSLVILCFALLVCVSLMTRFHGLVPHVTSDQILN